MIIPPFHCWVFPKVWYNSGLHEIRIQRGVYGWKYGATNPTDTITFYTSDTRGLVNSIQPVTKEFNDENGEIVTDQLNIRLIDQFTAKGNSDGTDYTYDFEADNTTMLQMLFRDPDDWNNTTIYNVGDFVLENDISYRCLLANQGFNPTDSIPPGQSPYWVIAPLTFETWIARYDWDGTTLEEVWFAGDIDINNTPSKDLYEDSTTGLMSADEVRLPDWTLVVNHISNRAKQYYIYDLLADYSINSGGTIDNYTTVAGFVVNDDLRFSYGVGVGGVGVAAGYGYYLFNTWGSVLGRDGSEFNHQSQVIPVPGGSPYNSVLKKHANIKDMVCRIHRTLNYQNAGSFSTHADIESAFDYLLPTFAADASDTPKAITDVYPDPAGSGALATPWIIKVPDHGYTTGTVIKITGNASVNWNDKLYRVTLPAAKGIVGGSPAIDPKNWLQLDGTYGNNDVWPGAPGSVQRWKFQFPKSMGSYVKYTASDLYVDWLILFGQSANGASPQIHGILSITGTGTALTIDSTAGMVVGTILYFPATNEFRTVTNVIDDHNFDVNSAITTTSGDIVTGSVTAPFTQWPITLNGITNISTLLKNICKQFGAIFRLDITPNGANAGDVVIVIEPRTKDGAAFPTALTPKDMTTGTELPRIMGKRAIAGSVAGDSGTVWIPRKFEDSNVQVQMPWRAHRFGYLDQDMTYNSNLDLMDQWKSFYPILPSDPKVADDYLNGQVNPDGWVGGAYLYILKSGGGVVDQDMEVYWGLDGDTLWAVHYMRANNGSEGTSADPDENDLKGYNAALAGGMFYAHELLENKTVVQRKFTGVQDDSGSIAAVRPDLQVSNWWYRQRLRNFRALKVVQSFEDHETTVDFVTRQTNYSLLPDLPYIEDNGGGTSGGVSTTSLTATSSNPPSPAPVAPAENLMDIFFFSGGSVALQETGNVTTYKDPVLNTVAALYADFPNSSKSGIPKRLYFRLAKNNGEYGNVAVGTLTNAATVQTLSLLGTPTGGVFNLNWSGEWTADLNYNASASDVQTALRALAGLSGSVVAVTGTSLPTGPLTITFNITNNTNVLTSFSALTGGTNPAVSLSITTLTQGATYFASGNESESTGTISNAYNLTEPVSWSDKLGTKIRQRIQERSFYNRSVLKMGTIKLAKSVMGVYTVSWVNDSDIVYPCSDLGITLYDGQHVPVTWAGGMHSYFAGNYVTYNGVVYVSTQITAGNQPDISPDYWTACVYPAGVDANYNSPVAPVAGNEFYALPYLYRNTHNNSDRVTVDFSQGLVWKNPSKPKWYMAAISHYLSTSPTTYEFVVRKPKIGQRNGTPQANSMDIDLAWRDYSTGGGTNLVYNQDVLLSPAVLGNGDVIYIDIIGGNEPLGDNNTTF